jgi:hypothetical protein
MIPGVARSVWIADTSGPEPPANCSLSAVAVCRRLRQGGEIGRRCLVLLPRRRRVDVVGAGGCLGGGIRNRWRPLLRREAEAPWSESHTHRGRGDRSIQCTERHLHRTYRPKTQRGYSKRTLEFACRQGVLYRRYRAPRHRALRTMWNACNSLGCYRHGEGQVRSRVHAPSWTSSRRANVGHYSGWRSHRRPFVAPTAASGRFFRLKVCSRHRWPGRCEGPRDCGHSCTRTAGHNRPLVIRSEFLPLDRLGWLVYGGQVELRFGLSRPGVDRRSMICRRGPDFG